MTTFPQYRRRNSNVNAVRWTAERPDCVPLWLAEKIEIIKSDGSLLLRNRTVVPPGSWVVAEEGLDTRVIADGDFRDAFERIPDAQPAEPASEEGNVV